MSNRDAYLADIARLRRVQKRCPSVREEFLLDVASMSREDLQERCLVQADWMSLFYHCLDGIPEIACLSGVDGCRDHRDVRAIVEALVKVCPLTFENARHGELKHPTSEKETA